MYLCQNTMRSSIFTLSLALLAAPSAIAHGRQDERRPLTRQSDQVPLPTSLTEAQLEAIYAGVCNETNSGVAGKVLRGDMEEFASSAIGIDARFGQIGTQLAAIDAQNLNNGTLFAPTWKKITQGWTNILWDSQATATNTAAYCTQFTANIMPIVVQLNTPLPTGVGTALAGAILANYSAMAAHLEAEAQAMSDAFTVLRNNVTAFTSTFASFAVNEKAADKVMIDNLQGNITVLVAQLNSLDIKIGLLALALSLTAVGTPVVASVVTSWAKRIVAAGVVAAIGELVEWNNLENEQDAVHGQLATAQNQIALLEAQLPAISAANYSLETIAATAETIATQLIGFNQIWNAVRSDAVQVQSYLNTLNSNSTLARQPAIYWGTRNHVPCTYEAIASALDSYAAGIANSPVPPPSRKRDLDFPARLHTDVQALIASVKAQAGALGLRPADDK
ncbi:hypothetical protein DFH09DRAFT_160940 [Mycena vulgaris]|nr:hypothetical protein DFH09DRAFT_160940 [Mycena vulgaris]